mgnify:FL=1
MIRRMRCISGVFCVFLKGFQSMARGAFFTCTIVNRRKILYNSTNKRAKKTIKIRKTHKKKRGIIQINEQTPSILLCKETAWQDTLLRLAVSLTAERI